MLRKEWDSLVKDSQDCVSLSIPRNLFDKIDDTVISLTLHGFCDASMTAYAAVVYLAIKTQKFILNLLL